MSPEPAHWLPVVPDRHSGVFLTRNGKLAVFSDVVTAWHINKYGLTYWLCSLPPAPTK